MIGLKRVVQSTYLVSIFAMVPVRPPCRDAIVPITGEKLHPGSALHQGTDSLPAPFFNYLGQANCSTVGKEGSCQRANDPGGPCSANSRQAGGAEGAQGKAW